MYQIGFEPNKEILYDAETLLDLLLRSKDNDSLQKILLLNIKTTNLLFILYERIKGDIILKN